jgi:hypothetical protein
MATTSVSIANANLALKINHVHLGQLNRDHGRVQHVSKSTPHSKHNGAEALANRHSAGDAADKVHLL